MSGELTPRSSLVDRRRVLQATVAIIVGSLAWLAAGYEPGPGSHLVEINRTQPTRIDADSAPFAIRFERPAGVVVPDHEMSRARWTSLDGVGLAPTDVQRPLVYDSQVEATNRVVWVGLDGGAFEVRVDGALLAEVVADPGANGELVIDFDDSLAGTSWLLLLAFIGWAGAALVVTARRFWPSAEAPVTDEVRRSRPSRILSAGAFPAGVWATLLVIFWPGLMNPDSVVQWNQLQLGRLRDWHPYPMNVALGMLRWIVDAPWLPISLIAGTAALLVGLAVVWAEDVGMPRWATRTSAGAVALTPVTAILTVTLWKDVVLGVAVLALVLALWRIETVGGEWLSGRFRNQAFVALACTVVWLTRHNGWPTVLLPLIVIVLLRPRARRGALIAGSMVLLTVFVVRGPLYRVMDVEPSPVAAIAYMQRLSAHVVAETPLEPEEEAFLNGIRSLDRPWPYDCATVQTTWFGDDVTRWEEYSDKEPQMRSLWLELSRRNPKVELDHLKCSTRILWQPTETGTYTYFLPGGTGAGFADTIPNGEPDLPVEGHPSRTLARVTFDFFQGLPAPLIRPPLYTLLLAGAVGYCAIRRRSLGPILVVTPVIAQTASLIPATLVQDTRFQYATILVAVVMSPMLVAWGRSSRPDDASRGRTVNSLDERHITM